MEWEHMLMFNKITFTKTTIKTLQMDQQMKTPQILTRYLRVCRTYKN